MKHAVLRIFVFFFLNFGALALGGFLMGPGPQGAWYQNLNQAPWTPPGWVFGAAWFTIMFSLSIALIRHYKTTVKTAFTVLYGLHLFLNIFWNFLFFNLQLTGVGLIIIMVLTLLVFFLYVFLRKKNRVNGFLVIPYLVWLCIATSLNAYVYFYN